ncbi:uncharacterized protein N7503_008417 [Penicillium pulvis]|uniref:uncharacterized protein n=1 Tax=Penicillium pulvis TaxID=1562058 RepID=UPI0025484E1A|nr:uncharacterized protein N7503_008417 [Penicillium pulvis]KAJ5792439.1 hypothetical protein N7503_008417 [Penicillium pulvis]
MLGFGTVAVGSESFRVSNTSHTTDPASHREALAPAGPDTAIDLIHSQLEEGVLSPVDHEEPIAADADAWRRG